MNLRINIFGIHNPWRREFSMKGAFALLVFSVCFIFQTAYTLTAATDNGSASGAGNGVSIRIGKHKNYIRFVLEGPAGYIVTSSVVVVGSSDIKISFPSSVSFSSAVTKERFVPGKSVVTPSGPRINVNENSVVITVDNLDDINVNEFGKPPKLVIDAFFIENPIRQPEAIANTVMPIEEFGAASGSLVIDAGHGGYDSGIRSDKVSEKDLVLSLSKELAAMPGKTGVKVYLTRKSDQALPLSRRIIIAKKIKPAVFLSLHISSGNGFVVYTAKESALAARLALKLAEQFHLEAANLQLPLPLLTGLDGVSLLLEMPSPEKFKYDRDMRRKLLSTLLEVLTYTATEDKSVSTGKDTNAN
jgi:N-acetylmuramoyl-L-alanine amidase